MGLVGCCHIRDVGLVIGCRHIGDVVLVVPVVLGIAESGLSTSQGSALESFAGAIGSSITLLGGAGGLFLCLVGVDESGVAAGLDFFWRKLLGPGRRIGTRP
jgi:hypothetical protein